MGTVFGVSVLLILTHAAAAVAGMLFLKPLLQKVPYLGKMFE